MLWNNATLDAHNANHQLLMQLEEASGDRLDQKANRYLTQVGEPGKDTGKLGDALDLEVDSTQYLKSDHELTKNETKVSVSLWVKFESLANYRWLVWEETDSQGYGRLEIYVDGTGTLYVYMRDSSTGTRYGGYSGSMMSTGTWYHILVSIDTVADTIYAWVNDSAWISISGVWSFGNFHNALASQGLSIGANRNGSGVWQNWNDGLIDQVSIWNDALDASDASALYNSGSGRAWIGPISPLGIGPDSQVGTPTVLGGAQEEETRRPEISPRRIVVFTPRRLATSTAKRPRNLSRHRALSIGSN